MRISILILLPGIILGIFMDEWHWSHFKVEHHCTNAGQEWRAGHPDWTVDWKGNLVPTYSSNPGRWLYWCDGGKLIWRDN